MIWAAVAYRRRHRSEVPEQTKYNLPIEIMYTVIPLFMVLGLFWFTARDQSEILAVKNDQDLTVNVVYGRPIYQVTEDLRRNVVQRVEGLTGLEVTEVNITVNDLSFPDQ